MKFVVLHRLCKTPLTLNVDFRGSKWILIGHFYNVDIKGLLTIKSVMRGLP